MSSIEADSSDDSSMDSSSDSSSVTSSIDSTENSETKSAFQAAKDQVDATDGDLVLECARGRDVKSPTETNYAFQVHRIRLAALSGFFQDMLDLASPNGSRYAVQDPTLEIPKVRMEEDWETVYILIGWAYNNRDIIRDLYRGCSWDLLLRVYNASHKYQFHTLEQLISNLMQANLERDDLVDCDPDLALRVWNRAHLFGDDDLAKVMLPEAIEVPLINIPRELIGEITASALMALIGAHNAEVHDMIEKLKKGDPGQTRRWLRN